MARVQNALVCPSLLLPPVTYQTLDSSALVSWVAGPNDGRANIPQDAARSHGQAIREWRQIVDQMGCGGRELTSYIADFAGCVIHLAA